MSEAAPPEFELEVLHATDRRVHSQLAPVDAVLQGALEACAEQRSQIVALSAANRTRAEIINDLTTEISALTTEISALNAEREETRQVIHRIRTKYGIRVKEDGTIAFSAAGYIRSVLQHWRG